MIPIPETPTTNYLQPKKAEGICGLAAVTNALEAVHYKDMEQFIRVLAGQRGLNAGDEIKLYKQMASIYWDFNTPVALKIEYPYFRWISCLLVHQLSLQDLAAMVRQGRSLDDEMKMLMERTGEKSFVAVVRLAPVD